METQQDIAQEPHSSIKTDAAAEKASPEPAFSSNTASMVQASNAFKRAASRVGAGVFVYVFSHMVLYLFSVSLANALNTVTHDAIDWYPIMRTLSIVIAAALFAAVVKGMPKAQQVPQRVLDAQDYLSLLLSVIACAGLCVFPRVLRMAQRPYTFFFDEILNFLFCSPPLAFVLACVVLPLAQGVFLRGVLYKRLIQYGDKAFIIVGALAYGFCGLNIPNFFFNALIGCLLCWIMTRSGHVWLSILVHAIANFLGLFIYSLAISAILPAPISAMINLLCIVVLVPAGLVCIAICFAIMRTRFCAPIEYVPEKLFRTAIVNGGMLTGILTSAFIALVWMLLMQMIVGSRI